MNIILLLCCITFVESSTYGVLYNVLNKYNTSFKLIKPTHKKTYVVMNLTKSIILGLLSIGFIYSLLEETFFEYNRLVLFGGIYVILDLIALFIVHKMQKNTIIHHIVVQILYVICLYYEFDLHNPIIKGILIYTVFSSVAYMVNGFLAMRIFVKEHWLNLLAKYSAYIYIGCCAINWIWQGVILTNVSWIPMVLYSSLLGLIIFDDITLIKYLLHYRYNME